MTSPLAALLAQLEEMEKRATPGPWQCEPRNICFYNDDGTLKPQTNELYLNEENQNEDCLGADVNGPPETDRATFPVRDAWLVVNTRNALPTLIAIIRAQAEALNKATTRLKMLAKEMKREQ